MEQYELFIKVYPSRDFYPPNNEPVLTNAGWCYCSQKLWCYESTNEHAAGEWWLNILPQDHPSVRAIKDMEPATQPPSVPAVEGSDVDWQDAKIFTNEEILKILADFTIAYKKSKVKDLSNDAAEYLGDRSKGKPYGAALAVEDDGEVCGKLIDQHIGKMFGSLEAASIEHFIQNGRINGSFRLRLIAMMQFYKWHLEKIWAAQPDEIQRLRDWKESAISLFRQIDEYVDKHPEKKLGGSKIDFVIERAKKYDEVVAGKAVNNSEHLTREALETELWAILPDDCKKIMRPLKKSYIESLMADIDSYATGATSTTQGAVWVPASERLPGWGKRVKWRLDGTEMKENDVLYMANGESPSVLPKYEWLDETGSQRQQAGATWVKADAIKFLKWLAEYYKEEGEEIHLIDGVWQYIDDCDEYVQIPEEQMWELYNKHNPVDESTTPESDAEAFLTWVIENHNTIIKQCGEHEQRLWINRFGDALTTAKLYQEFKKK